MEQNRATSESHYRRFVEQVRESGEVWGLHSTGGWAYCASHEYEETDVLVFWSERADAQRLAKGEWKGHAPTSISVDDFIEQWLRGMHEDGALVGPNWDAELSGLEVEPRDLADALSDEEEG